MAKSNKILVTGGLGRIGLAQHDDHDADDQGDEQKHDSQGQAPAPPVDLRRERPARFEIQHDLTYHTIPDLASYGHRIVIRGEITDPRKLTEYYLRWPNQTKS